MVLLTGPSADRPSWAVATLLSGHAAGSGWRRAKQRVAVRSKAAAPMSSDIRQFADITSGVPYSDDGRLKQPSVRSRCGRAESHPRLMG